MDPCAAGGVLTDSPIGPTVCFHCGADTVVVPDFRNRRIAAHLERDLTRAYAIGFTKAAIRRAVVLNDPSSLPQALELLEAV